MTCLSLSLEVWDGSREACGLALVPQEPCWWQPVFFCTFVALSSRGTRSHMDLCIENLYPFCGMMRVFDWNWNLTAFLGFPASQESMLARGNRGRWKPRVACDGRLFWISAFLLCFVSWILLCASCSLVSVPPTTFKFFFCRFFFLFHFLSACHRMTHTQQTQPQTAFHRQQEQHIHQSGNKVREKWRTILEKNPLGSCTKMLY